METSEEENVKQAFWGLWDLWSSLMNVEDDKALRRKFGLSKPTIERYRTHISAPHIKLIYSMMIYMVKQMGLRP